MFVRMGLGYHTQYNFSCFSHLPAHFIVWFGFIALRFLVYVYHVLLTYASVGWTFRLTWFPRCCVCVLESKHRSSYLPGQDFANWAGSAFSVPLPTSINSVPSPKETKALLGETNAWFDYTHAVLRVPTLDIVFIGTMSKTGYWQAIVGVKTRLGFLRGAHLCPGILLSPKLLGPLCLSPTL